MDAARPARRSRVVVVGGGVSGLAAAYELTRRADAANAPAEVLLLEASARTGGTVRTLRREGFLLEAGPDSFISEKPEAAALARELGLGPHLVETNEAHRRSFVVRAGRLRPVPEGFQLLAPARLWPFVTTDIFTWAGKLRMALEVLIPRRTDDADESLADFVRRRFGREALERMAQPMVGGIYTADPEQLSLRATMPRFLDMERDAGSVILALLKARRAARRAARADGKSASSNASDTSAAFDAGGASDARATTRDGRATTSGAGATTSGVRATHDGRGTSGARYSLFLSLDGGVQMLTDRLAAQLPPGTIRTDARVESLDFNSDRRATRDDDHASPHDDASAGSLGARAWRLRLSSGETVEADAVCLALPAHAAARLLAATDAALAAELAAIPYASTATINLAYRRADIPHALDGFGFVAPHAERRRVIACTFASVKFAGRAPAGHALLRAFVGGALQPDMFALDEDAMIDAARRDLRELLGVSAPPLFAEVSKWPRSMAQYPVGHLARMARVRARLAEHPTLRLAGNAYHGAGLPDCIRAGRTAAQEILRAVGGEEGGWGMGDGG